ncbi:filamentous hemagglutinin outer membrane protein [Nostoc commune NIES-4072]|uniref:Filamentous hemagglutinin outer membrane protein n=1 Tax=Nostoc commune NIES-4072 TaxID=2005467 RepID=A0A2R5FLP6_NOSCO|nr:filamentous hemagglutinin N-terminal domain-containing protein [Nostoc commune]BBD69325.1 filamentous hemagglutinin outer membrane protein [Nostoc commune HK-02]GBG19680.1 filamentous hemagglutinin outer membrane protein [Nostoc commune NIES-4072]
MSKINIRWGWFIGIAICGSSIGSTNCAFAQITPDGTLPNNSIVTPDGSTLNITGGTPVGSNLFHSFSKFSVPFGGTAFFNNSVNIQNIISRVTGGSRSDIDGIIRTNPTANLFLINPNGIVFGKNAQLNIGGSFVATTANALQFGNRGFFSASEKNIPSPLLTINPSALLFNQINQNAVIQNNSIAFAGQDPTGFFDVFGLRVPDGKSLLLVGGNVSMDEGQLNAYSGRVELGGLAKPGTVALSVDGDNLSLRFPENVARTSVSLTNQAGIYVEGAGGGNIAVNAFNLEILGGSVLNGGIGSGLGTSETVAEDITLNATGSIKVAGSIVANLVQTGSKGNGGNITIDSGSFSLQDGAQLTASTVGQGNAGNVTVRARDALSLADANIFSRVDAGGVGKGGNIDINAATLSLIDGARLQTTTDSASDTEPAGRGDAGNVNVNITGAVDIAGEKNGFSSGIFSRVETETVGNGGNITIDSGSFFLRDGAQLSASTFGQGNAGNVAVRALDAVSLVDNAAILSTVGTGGVGKGGNIDINAATLSIINGAQVLTITREAFATQASGRGDAGNVNVNVTGIVDIAGEKNGILSGIRSSVQTGTVGNGGNITIDSGSFSLQDGAQLVASTFGQGNAGNVTVRALDTVDLADSAGIFSTVSAGGVGKGGNIDINAATLSIINGAQLQTLIREASATQPAGRGDAGNVNVNVTGVVDIAGQKNGFFSTISSDLETGTVGTGGNITIDSGSFSLSDGAQLAASTSGLGNAGNVTVRALDTVTLADAYIFSTVEAGGVGKGGNIDINAVTLSLKDAAQVLTRTDDASATQPAGRGDAGNVNINVTGAIDIAGQKNGFVSGIGSNLETGTVGNGGNITIDSGSFSLSDGAQLAASTSGLGNAGNVTVRALDAVTLADANIFSTVEAGGVGKGGNIDINAAILSLDGAQLLTSTRSAFATQPGGRGDAGNVNINVTGIVDIAGEKNGFVSAIGSRVETGAVGNGGNITINSGSLSLQDGAQLVASTSGLGNAGNVTVRALDAVSLVDNASIFSTVSAGGVGKGGNIDINAATLSLFDGAQLLTLTDDASATAPAGRGDAGNVNINVTGIVDIAGQKNGFSSGIGSNLQTGAVGNGGNITINSGSFSLQNGAQLAASTSGLGNAGTIKVNAADFFTISSNSSNINTGLFVNSQSPTGTAGDIIVTSPRVTLDNGGTLNAQSASGNGGDINLQTDLLLLRRGASITTTAGTALAGGNGGNITINAPSGFIVAVPNEDSDITANAYTGSGGRVDIRAFGIYGIQKSQFPTSLSDITASSEFGVNGTVELNTPDIDPNSGLVNLPAVPVDTQVAQTCQAGGNLAKSSFTITGRGGLPPNPGEALSADAVQVDLVTLNPKGDPPDRSYSTSKITTPAPEPIIEATGLTLNQKGEVVLTANLPKTSCISREKGKVGTPLGIRGGGKGKSSVLSPSPLTFTLFPLLQKTLLQEVSTTTPHTPWLKPASCKAIRNS